MQAQCETQTKEEEKKKMEKKYRAGGRMLCQAGDCGRAAGSV
jgi:hypothetical protein